MATRVYSEYVERWSMCRENSSSVSFNNKEKALGDPKISLQAVSTFYQVIT